MHIIVIAWLWVILMMAITERSVTAGVLTFLLFGLAPCVLLLWLVATQRRYRRQRSADRALDAATDSVGEKQAKQGDGKNAQSD